MNKNTKQNMFKKGVVNESEDKETKLRELKEMSLLSLSHASLDDFEEITKIIKNFFAIFFDIKEEFTYSELLRLAESAGIPKDKHSKLTILVNKLNEVLYKKEKVTKSDAEKIRDMFIDVMNVMVPEEKPAEIITVEKPKAGFSLIPPIKLPQLNLPKLQIIPKPKQQLVREIPKKEVKLKEGIKTPETKIQQKKEQGIAKEENYSKKIIELGAKVAALEKMLAKTKSKSNPFLELQLEAIKTDMHLLSTDPKAISLDELRNKINALKSKIA